MGKEARLHGVPDRLGPGVSRTGGTVRTKSAQAGLCHTANSRKTLCLQQHQQGISPSPSEQDPVACKPRALLLSLAKVPVHVQCMSSTGYGMLALSCFWSLGLGISASPCFDWCHERMCFLNFPGSPRSPASTKTWVLFPALHKPVTVVHICHPILWETKAGRSWILGHPWLHKYVQSQPGL